MGLWQGKALTMCVCHHLIVMMCHVGMLRITGFVLNTEGSLSWRSNSSKALKGFYEGPD